MIKTNNRTFGLLCSLCIVLLFTQCSFSSPLRDLQKLAENNDLIKIDIQETDNEKYVFVQLMETKTFQSVLPILKEVEVSELMLSKIHFRESDFKIISQLPIKKLTIGSCALNESGMIHLRNLLLLEELKLSHSSINDSGLEFLLFLENLKKLNLNSKHLDGTGLKYLTNCKELEEIVLTSSTITDEGLESLPPLPSLKVIWLGQTRITPKGLEHLTTYPSLQKISGSPGLLVEEGIRLHKMHLEARKKAEEQGISLPSDDLVPYVFFTKMIERDRSSYNEKIIRYRQKAANSALNKKK